MKSSKFVSYLWNKDLKTRFNIFGAYTASLVTLLAGWNDISIVLLTATFFFLLLELQSIQSKYFKLLMKQNGLETDKIKSGEELLEKISDN